MTLAASARSLATSERTVGRELATAQQQLGLRSRNQLAAWSIELRIALPRRVLATRRGAPSRRILQPRQQQAVEILIAGHNTQCLGRTLNLSRDATESLTHELIVVVGAWNMPHAAALAVVYRLVDPTHLEPVQSWEPGDRPACHCWTPGTVWPPAGPPHEVPRAGRPGDATLMGSRRTARLELSRKGG